MLYCIITLGIILTNVVTDHYMTLLTQSTKINIVNMMLQPETDSRTLDKAIIIQAT